MFVNLPEELNIAILSCLTEESDLVAVQQVSQMGRRLARDASLWQAMAQRLSPYLDRLLLTLKQQYDTTYYFAFALFKQDAAIALYKLKQKPPADPNNERSWQLDGFISDRVAARHRYHRSVVSIHQNKAHTVGAGFVRVHVPIKTFLIGVEEEVNGALTTKQGYPASRVEAYCDNSLTPILANPFYQPPVLPDKQAILPTFNSLIPEEVSATLEKV